MVGLPFTPEMYCNDWTDDEADSSWWIPVALRVAVSGSSLLLHVTCHVTFACFISCGAAVHTRDVLQ
jgi:hypothetical protein